ncbi:unnamed protein product [Amoebophrya sp. A25]|nr:unnamed protein product [Amoebophrya sp. A25]|eukprot:GSA25T00012004001.1
MVIVVNGVLEVSRRTLRLSTFSLSTHLLLAQGISHEQEKQAVIDWDGDVESQDMDGATAFTQVVTPPPEDKESQVAEAIDMNANALRKIMRKAAASLALSHAGGKPKGLKMFDNFGLRNGDGRNLLGPLEATDSKPLAGDHGSLTTKPSSPAKSAALNGGGVDAQALPSLNTRGADRRLEEKTPQDLQQPLSGEAQKNVLRATVRKVNAGLVKRLGNTMNKRGGPGVNREAFLGQLVDDGVFKEPMDLNPLKQIAKQVRKALIDEETELHGHDPKRKEELEALIDATDKSAELNARLEELAFHNHETSDSDRLVVEIQLLLLTQLADIDQSEVKRAVENRSERVSLDGWRRKTTEDLLAIIQRVDASTIEDAIASGSASSGSPDQNGGQFLFPIPPSVPFWNLF